MEWLLALALTAWLFTWRALRRERAINHRKTIKEMVQDIQSDNQVLVVQFKSGHYVKFGHSDVKWKFGHTLRQFNSMKAVGKRPEGYSLSTEHYDLNIHNPDNVAAFIDSE